MNWFTGESRSAIAVKVCLILAGFLLVGWMETGA